MSLLYLYFEKNPVTAALLMLFIVSVVWRQIMRILDKPRALSAQWAESLSWIILFAVMPAMVVYDLLTALLSVVLAILPPQDIAVTKMLQFELNLYCIGVALYSIIWVDKKNCHGVQFSRIKLIFQLVGEWLRATPIVLVVLSFSVFTAISPSSVRYVDGAGLVTILTAIFAISLFSTSSIVLKLINIYTTPVKNQVPQEGFFQEYFSLKLSNYSFNDYLAKVVTHKGDAVPSLYAIVKSSAISSYLYLAFKELHVLMLSIGLMFLEGPLKIVVGLSVGLLMLYFIFLKAVRHMEVSPVLTAWTVDDKESNLKGYISKAAFIEHLRAEGLLGRPLFKKIPVLNVYDATTFSLKLKSFLICLDSVIDNPKSNRPELLNWLRKGIIEDFLDIKPNPGPIARIIITLLKKSKAYDILDVSTCHDDIIELRSKVLTTLNVSGFAEVESPFKESTHPIHFAVWQNLIGKTSFSDTITIFQHLSRQQLSTLDRRVLSRAMHNLNQINSEV